jgi:hypothetical protein
MVRRGSTVRVRQRALQKRRKWALFLSGCLQDLQYAVRVEPFMEPSGSERTLQSVENGAFAVADNDTAFVPEALLAQTQVGRMGSH